MEGAPLILSVWKEELILKLSLLWLMRGKVCLNVELRFVRPIMVCIPDYHLLHSLKAVVNKNNCTNNIMLQASRSILYWYMQPLCTFWLYQVVTHLSMNMIF